MNEIKEIIETIQNMNFCGLCTTGNCRECIRKKAKEKAIEALKKPPQIIEILEGDLLIIKTDAVLHPVDLYKIKKEVMEQKESGTIVLDGRFDYTIVKMNKEDAACNRKKNI